MLSNTTGTGYSLCELLEKLLLVALLAGGASQRKACRSWPCFGSLAHFAPPFEGKMCLRRLFHQDDKGTVWRADESGSGNQYLIVEGGVGDGG